MENYTGKSVIEIAIVVSNYVKQGYESRKCAKEHLNNREIQHRLYREGLCAEDFKQQLREVVCPNEYT